MKAHLMFRDADFYPRPEPSAHTPDLVSDLGLEAVFATMAGNDRFLDSVARAALLAPLTDPAAIRYRQDVLADAIAHEDVVRRIYDVAVDALAERKRQAWPTFLRSSTDSILHNAVTALEIFVDRLAQLRELADHVGDGFSAGGFVALFAAIRRELDDEYLQQLRDQLIRSSFRAGVAATARLDTGNKSVDWQVRRPLVRRSFSAWLDGLGEQSFTVVVPARDEAGHRELGELRARALDPVANALAQSCDHIAGFFTQLRCELGFYLGGVNLYRRLTEGGARVCFPVPEPADSGALAARGLYDPVLALRRRGRVVPNDVLADGRGVIVMTGANQGGKSTLLRALGVAQLMLGAGMFVPAQSMRAPVVSGVFTHYKRSEDATMVRGRFDDELARLRTITDLLRPGALLLMNESFASTNEREGAEIAMPVIRALVDARIRSVIVTHSYELADRLRQDQGIRSLFLRAERRADGRRTFRLVEALPQPTSHGVDLYREVFGPRS